jgi:hypothetical protein
MTEGGPKPLLRVIEGGLTPERKAMQCAVDAMETLLADVVFFDLGDYSEKEFALYVEMTDVEVTQAANRFVQEVRTAGGFKNIDEFLQFTALIDTLKKRLQPKTET